MTRATTTLLAVLLVVLFGPEPSEADDPMDAHRWHMPRRGARDLSRDVVGPAYEDWNKAGHVINDGKERLSSWGLLFDVDLAFFDQYANRVTTGQQNFGSFSWRVMGDAELLDLGETGRFALVGESYLGLTTYGTAGLGYDPAETTLTSNVGAIDALNATITEVGAVVDELYWKQVAWRGNVVVMGGKIDFAYHFDSNRIANDAFSEFFAYSLQNNPSIPTPLFGGFGGIVRANLPGKSYVMLGVGDSSMDAPVLPWETLDNDSWYEVIELGITSDLPGLGEGTYRLTPWHNHLFGEDGFGVALGFDQALFRKNLVAFFRFGYGDEDVTPVRAFVSGGLAFLRPFGRENDRVALGVAWSDPSPGNGARSESLLEIQYRVEVVKAVSITPELHIVFDPSDNPAANVVVIPGIRLLIAL